MSDLWAALCLVAILEGVFLFAMPGGWKRAVARLLELPDERVRRIGAAVLIAGLVSLWLVRGG